jgi:hypothetical protein
MIDIWSTIFIFLKVNIAFLILYYFIPSRIIKFEKDDKILDKFFISLFHSSTLIIIVVHLLVTIKLYDTFSLYLVLIIAYIFLLRRKVKDIPDAIYTFGMKGVANVLDLSEGRYGLIGGIVRKTRDAINLFLDRLKRGFIDFLKKPFSGILLFIPFMIGAYVRYSPVFENLRFLTSDTYVHQLWIKHILDSFLFKAPVYPRGYHAILSVFEQLFFLDTYYVLRFMGPFAGILIITSIIYGCKRLFKNNQYICFIAVVLYLFYQGLPASQSRQIAALPQEFALIFMLPGIVFYVKYFKTKKLKYLILAAEAVFITIMVHPYVTFGLGIAYVFIALLNLKTFIGKSVFFKNVLYFGGSIVAGFLPFFLGIALAKEESQKGQWAYALRNIKGDASAGTALEGSAKSIFEFKEINEFLGILISAALIIFVLSVLIYLITLKLKDSEIRMQVKTSIVLLVSSLFLYIMYRAQFLGLPKVMESLRTGIIFSVLIVVALSSVLFFISLLFKKKYLKTIISIIAVISIIGAIYMNNSFRLETYKGSRMEYDESVYVYLKIKKEFRASEWQIISPVEQYSYILRNGWHIELWAFVKAIDERKGDLLRIEADDIFLFVEKQILHTKDMVSEELSNQPFPDDPTRLSEYYAVGSRGVLESKAYFWAEEFLRTREEMSVYFENDVYKVYHIHQENPKEPILLLNK